MAEFFDATGELVCAICQDGGEMKEWKKLTCGHAVHSSCAADWFRTKRDECPICRDSPSANARDAVRDAVRDDREMLLHAGVPEDELGGPVPRL